MKNYFFITGTGKGIGKALTEILLKDKQNFVYGLSRANEIESANFQFVKIDLSDNPAIENYTFPVLEDVQSITLINNAGVIGDIKPIGKKNNASITETITVNTTAPIVLINSFITTYQEQNIEKLILNISSGAGRHPIHSWADYCASKSAVDMLSETIKFEQTFFKEENRVKIFSVAPGVVDTEMQVQIRNTSKDDFSNVERFISLNENKELSSPKFVAEKLLHILSNSDKFNDVILDIRNIS